MSSQQAVAEPVAKVILSDRRSFFEAVCKAVNELKAAEESKNYGSFGSVLADLNEKIGFGLGMGILPPEVRQISQSRLEFITRRLIDSRPKEFLGEILDALHLYANVAWDMCNEIWTVCQRLDASAAPAGNQKSQ